MVQANAATTELSNDRVMKLDEERLARRLRMSEMAVQKFWKKLPILENIETYK